MGGYVTIEIEIDENPLFDKSNVDVDPSITTPPVSEKAQIQPWIKTSVGYWADGVSSDDEFINAIQFLIKEGIMRIQS